MKDGLHLTVGTGFSVLVIALYLLGWGALQKCLGGEYEEPKAPAEILNLGGYALEMSGGAWYAIPAASWDRLTNAVARLEATAQKRWDNDHRTRQGREYWHGAATNRVVTAGAVTWLYPDGYAYSEKAAPARVRPVQSAPQAKRNPSAVRASLPPKLEASRRARETARQRAREVNVTFGPGGKVVKFEEGKGAPE